MAADGETRNANKTVARNTLNGTLSITTAVPVKCILQKEAMLK
jgi:hypothetical protein